MNFEKADVEVMSPFVSYLEYGDSSAITEEEMFLCDDWRTWLTSEFGVGHFAWLDDDAFGECEITDLRGPTEIGWYVYLPHDED